MGIYPELIRGALFSQYPIVKDYVLVLFKRSRLNQWNGQETAVYYDSVMVTSNPAVIPEPASVALLGLALAGVLTRRTSR